MAPTSSKFCVLLSLTLFQLHLVSGGRLANGSSPLNQGLEEKTTTIHFFFHDIIVGEEPTAEKVAEVEMSKTSMTGFGMVALFDDPLTEGPDATSKLIGRAQGLYASASQNDLSLLMVLNYVFLEGEYNGSSLSILGRNSIFSSTREMPVIGGTGMFRLARGYALAKTYSLDLLTGNAVVEYNVTVIHY
ncbi:dirigent protein 1-like [Nymphaea colorata]|uniref:Dirigent protein n=1 Tax=Nymphaea colorata TaxID=210225 RepID=A0A5K0V3F2_9MAGN|nr:dirigent protein 1-like [Nymphaea colorata]